MADVGKRTGKQTQAGKDVYETPEGEMVSEKSTTIEYRGKWINVPTIHGGKQYSESELLAMLDEGLIKPTSVHNELEEAIEAAQSRSNSLEFSKGGATMKYQMELFEDGGLRDEGGMIDEESGNDVPSGSTRKEVRDDIPAMISEGEFIFPADVVRYIGLDKLMRIRQDAKMGLKEMEAMGQMGNSDEATMPDDLPFGMADLIIVEEPEEKAHGGMVDEYNTGGIVWPTHPTIPVETVTYHNPETGEKIEVRTQQGVPIDAVPEGFVLFDSTPVTPTTPATQPTAFTAPQRAVSNDNDSTPTPVNKFVEAGGWNSAPLETYISEAEKITGLTGSIMSGVVAVIGGPVVGIFAHLAQKANKNKILATIDARIEEAKKTTVPGQVAALRAMKDKLEGKADNQSILGKIGDVLSNVVDSIGNSLGLTSDQKDKVKKVAVAAEGTPTTSAPTSSTSGPTSLGEGDQEVVDAVTSGGVEPLTPEQKRQLVAANLDPGLAEAAFSTIENMVIGSSYDEIPSSMNRLTRTIPVDPSDLVLEMFNVETQPNDAETAMAKVQDYPPITSEGRDAAGDMAVGVAEKNAEYRANGLPIYSYENPLLSFSPKTGFPNFVQDEALRRRQMPDTSPVTLSLDGAAKTDANRPPSLVNPDTLASRTSIAQNNANELIARNLARQQSNLSDRIKELVGINTLGDAPIAGTSKDPRVTPTVEPTVDIASDNYNTNRAEERRKQILKLTGQDSQDSSPPTPAEPVVTAPRVISRNQNSGNDDGPSNVFSPQAVAKAAKKATKEASLKTFNLSPTEKQGGAALDSAFGISGLSKGGMPKKKRGLAVRK